MSCGVECPLSEVTVRLCIAFSKWATLVMKFVLSWAHKKRCWVCRKKTRPLIALDFINELNDVWRKGDETITLIPCALIRAFVATKLIDFVGYHGAAIMWKSLIMLEMRFQLFDDPVITANKKTSDNETRHKKKIFRSFIVDCIIFFCALLVLNGEKNDDMNECWRCLRNKLR